MTAADKATLGTLTNLAHKKFSSELQAGESRVLLLSFKSTSSEVEETPELQAPENIRPEFIRWLISDSDAFTLLDQSGISVNKGVFSGVLNLFGLTFQLPIYFAKCLFAEGLNLHRRFFW